MSLLYAPVFLFFWINYNIAFFRGIDSNKKATGSALYAFAFSLLSAIMPVLAGYTAVKFGMPAVFYIGAAVMAVTLFAFIQNKGRSSALQDFKLLKMHKRRKNIDIS